MATGVLGAGILGSGVFACALFSCVFGGGGIVIFVSQDGQLIRRPLHLVAARMCWPQVGQLNLNSVMAGVDCVHMRGFCKPGDNSCH